MNKNIVKWMMMLSVLATVLWLIGLGWTINNQFFSKPSIAAKTTPAADVKEETGGLHIVALGDSLTRGTGDQAGKGYVGYLVDELKEKTNDEINVTNLAIKGQRSAALVSQLQQGEIQRQIKKADVIVMTIGGNDLFRSGEGLNNFSTTEMNQWKDGYIKNLNNMFKEVRRLNPEATVFHVGLYNPFNDLADGKTTSAIVREWNFASAQTAANYEHIIAVPTFDLFELHVNDYLYSDKFHPNTAGYKLIGERVASLITFSEEEEQHD